MTSAAKDASSPDCGQRAVVIHKPWEQDVWEATLQDSGFPTLRAAREMVEQHQPLNRQLQWDSNGAGVNSAQKALMCTGLGCDFRARFKRLKPSVLWKVDMAASRLHHVSFCGGCALGSIDQLANDPFISELFSKNNVTQRDIADYARTHYEIDLTPTDITRLKEKVEKTVLKEIKANHLRLVPFLIACTSSNDTMTVHLRFRLEAAKPETTTILFARGQMFHVNKATSTELSLKDMGWLQGATILLVLVVWPWAEALLDCGPPVYALDAAHTREGLGRISHVGIRVAGTNVPLATQLHEHEDAESMKILFDTLLESVPKMLKRPLAIISDRGRAIRAALDSIASERPKQRFQVLYDKPHLFRNIVARFPALKRLGNDRVLTLVNSVLYATNDQLFEGALAELDKDYAEVAPKHRRAAPTPAASAEQSEGVVRDGAAWRLSGDGEEPDDAALFAGNELSSYLESIKDKDESELKPSDYVRRIPPEHFLVYAMPYSDHNVNSSNSVEAQNSWQLRRGLRDCCPSLALFGIMTAVSTFLSNQRDKIDSYRKLHPQEVAFPCWPSASRGNDTPGKRVNEYSVSNLSAQGDPDDASGRQALTLSALVCHSTPGRTHPVRWAPQRVFEWCNPPAAHSERYTHWCSRPSASGAFCGGGCFGPQREGIACTHWLRAAAEPEWLGHQRALPGQAATCKRCVAEVARLDASKESDYCSVVAKVFAPWYRVETLLDMLKKVRIEVPSLPDLASGPEFVPISPFPKFQPLWNKSNGGRPVDESADSDEVMGKPPMSPRKRHSGELDPSSPKRAYRCSECGSLGHNKRKCSQVALAAAPRGEATAMVVATAPVLEVQTKEMEGEESL